MTNIHKAAREAQDPKETAKQLQHCAIAVSDWLAGGCDVHDIPRPHIAALVAWAKETAELSEAPGEERDGWVLVPVEPTEAMINAAYDALESYPMEGNIRRHYRAMLAARPEAPTVAPDYTYTSTQATNCAGCGKHKHTPLRIDAMGGYVCLTCIDQKLGTLLGEFGYPSMVALTDEQVDAGVYAVCPDFDAAHEGPSIDDVRAIAHAIIAKFCEVNGLSAPTEGKEGGA